MKVFSISAFQAHYLSLKCIPLREETSCFPEQDFSQWTKSEKGIII